MTKKKVISTTPIIHCDVQANKARSIFTVINEKGLHTRPSTELARLVNTFNSEVILTYNRLSINAKSVIGILTLGAGRGAKIQVEATGSDAEFAIQSILGLASAKFHFSY